VGTVHGCVPARVPGVTGFGRDTPEERGALIALYNSTNGDGWNNNTGWKTPPLADDGFALPGTGNTCGLSSTPTGIGPSRASFSFTT